MDENQKKLPLPEKELPAPHDMLLNPVPPNAGLLRAPNFWEKHAPSLHPVLMVLIFSFLVADIAYFSFLGLRSNRQTNIQPTPTIALSPSPTPVPEKEFSIEQVDTYSKKYIIHKFYFEITVPNNFDIYTDDRAISFNNRLFKEDMYKAVISIFVFPNEYDGKNEYILNAIQEKETLVKLKPYTSRSLHENSELANALVYKRVADMIIAGANAPVFENYTPWELPDTMLEKRVYITPDENSYLISGLIIKNAIKTDDITAKQFNDIVSTFKFLDLDQTETPVACTEEAKVCPDGSSVGRTGPKCEFAECP